MNICAIGAPFIALTGCLGSEVTLTSVPGAGSTFALDLPAAPQRSDGP